MTAHRARLPVAAFTLFLLAACAGVERAAPAGPADAGLLILQGTLLPRAYTALAPDGVAVIELREGSQGDGAVVAELRLPVHSAAAPLPFEMAVARTRLRADARHALRGTVVAPGQASWASDALAVDVRAARIDAGALALQLKTAQPLVGQLQCGTHKAGISAAEAGLRLAVDGDMAELAPVAAPAGQRFVAAGLPETSLWVRGDSATLVWRGRALPECKPAAGAVVGLRASGSGPAWQLDIGARETRFSADGVALRVPTTALDPQPGGRRLLAGTAEQGLSVFIADRACSSGPAGLPHPHTVSVNAGGRVYSGCGGDPASLLQGGPWTVQTVGGVASELRPRATLEFGSNGRLSGSAGCNPYDTAYRLSATGLVIDKPADSLRACAPALMAQEARFLDGLRSVQRFEMLADGSLVLLAGDGRRIVARR